MIKEVKIKKENLVKVTKKNVNRWEGIETAYEKYQPDFHTQKSLGNNKNPMILSFGGNSVQRGMCTIFA